MTYIRGQERMVYQRIFDTLTEGLLGPLDWSGTSLRPPGETALQFPYGATYPLIFEEMIPDPKLSMVEPNTVAISEGRMPDENEEELGASEFGLVSVDHTFFVDVYGETQSIARALGGDVRAIFTGRLGFKRYLLLRDYRLPGAPEIPGHAIWFQDVELDFPAVGSPNKLHWTVLKFTAVHQYNG